MAGPLVMVVGSFNMDLVFQISRRPERGETVTGHAFTMALGGKGVNQAVAAARLGAQVRLVGRVGKDVFGDMFLQKLAEEGFDLAHVTRDATEGTGVAAPILDASGDNSIIVVPRANRRVTPGDVDAAWNGLPIPKLLLVQNEIALAATQRAVARAREAGVPVVFNPAPAACEPLPPELIAGAYVITPNEHEALALTGIRPQDPASDDAAALALQAMGAQHVVLTLGERGAFVRLAGGETRRQAPLPVTVVDTTGAGDAFNGGLAYGLAAGLDILAAVELANTAGAVAVTRLGAVPAMPSAEDVRLLRRRLGLAALV